jgi:biopolymer transport protein ExbD
MVAAPLKQARFEARVPSPSDDRPMPPNPWTLAVTIEPDHTLKLNALADMGTVEDTAKLSLKLSEVFQERKRNHACRYDLLNSMDLPEDLRVEKTVFIKAPRTIDYGDLAKVIDVIKGAGAMPVGLQLDGLN